MSMDPKERVPYILPYDISRQNEPLEVRVNDYVAVIKRGVEVMIPYYVREHLREMERQDARTMERLQGIAARAAI